MGHGQPWSLTVDKLIINKAGEGADLKYTVEHKGKRLHRLVMEEMGDGELPTKAFPFLVSFYKRHEQSRVSLGFFLYQRQCLK